MCVAFTFHGLNSLICIFVLLCQADALLNFPKQLCIGLHIPRAELMCTSMKGDPTGNFIMNTLDKNHDGVIAINEAIGSPLDILENSLVFNKYKDFLKGLLKLFMHSVPKQN
jgi:hypothetical protein